MSPLQLIKTLVIVAVIGYLAVELEAKNLDKKELEKQARDIQNDFDQILLDTASTNLDQIADDDDIDEDDKNPALAAQPTNQRYQSVPNTDLKASASHHGHHGHGAKGWLDMGAWTGKKGAFGWYDKHPVGGKKGK